MVSSPFSDSGPPKNRIFVRLEYCSSFSRSASYEDSLASRAAIYWSFISNRSLSCDMFSLNVSSLLVRACGLSTWRKFWMTASFDESSTNLTSRASSFGPISAVSEALSPLRLGGMIGYKYFKKIRHKFVNSLPRSKRCHTSAAILNNNFMLWFHRSPNTSPCSDMVSIHTVLLQIITNLIRLLSRLRNCNIIHLTW